MIPLPDAGISKVIGLLEVLFGLGNQSVTVKLAEELNFTLETLLPVIEAGEQLGLIEVAGGKVKLTEFGLRLVKGKIIERKVILKERLISLDPFKRTIDLLKTKNNSRMSRKSLQKIIRQELPKEQADRTVSKIIEWGRHADLIGYNSDLEEVYLNV